MQPMPPPLARLRVGKDRNVHPDLAQVPFLLCFCMLPFIPSLTRSAVPQSLSVSVHPPQVCHPDQGVLANMARRREARGPPPPQICQHGPGPVPAGQDQDLYQSPRVSEYKSMAPELTFTCTYIRLYSLFIIY